MICVPCQNKRHYDCINNTSKDDEEFCDCEDEGLTEEEKQKLGKEN